MRIRRSGGTANTDVTSIEVEAAASKVRAQMIEDEKIRPEHESKVTGVREDSIPWYWYDEIKFHSLPGICNALWLT